MDYSVKDFYVPTITYFTSGNKLTGSRTGMNYKMTPIEERRDSGAGLVRPDEPGAQRACL